MASNFSVIQEQGAFAVAMSGKPLLTPERKMLALPTRALAEAVKAEWEAQEKGRFNAAKMPLTALAYTAIDRVEGSKDDIIQMLLSYVDTDTLCYRSGGSKTLLERQRKEWDPLLDWSGKRLGASWATTIGVMPLEQNESLHRAVEKHLQGLSAMRLAGYLLASSVCSSLALAHALVEKHIDAQEAFRLSRLEEESQAETWGRDSEAERRATLLQAEIVSAERFLRLLDAV